MVPGAPTPLEPTTPETEFLKGGPRRVRSGPLAAVVATVAVLGATAVPRMAPAPAPFEAARSLEVAPARAALDGEVALDLGLPFGAFRIEDTSTAVRRSDGSLRVHLVASALGEERSAGGFEGSLDLRGPLAADLAAAEGLRVLAPPREGEGAPALAPVDAPPPGARCFRAARGRLVGTGALAGYELSLRNAPGVLGWSGPFGEADAALTVGLVWYLDAAPAGDPDADMGGGWLAVRRD